MKTEYASEMNQYPTIFLSFANAKGNKISIISSIKQNLIKLYQLNKHLFQDLDEFDMIIYKGIMESLAQYNNGSANGIENALSFLMERMERYYHKKVMVFIDEYDTPFIEAHVNGFYNEIRENLSSMLHQALKSSDSLQYAMLTGIQRVAKENLFSDLNNLVVNTVADEDYSQYFGFTELEVKELLEYYDLELNDKVKAMYNGYHFGNLQIYNPWSILGYAASGKLKSYWVNTSSNSMIKQAMKSADEVFNEGYERLVENGELKTQVRMETSFFEANTTASLWGLLINAGYLTIDKTISFDQNKYIIRIPNQEVQKEFQDLTSYYLKVSDTELSDLFDALIDEEQKSFEIRYQKLLMTLPSYHDLKDENSYHVLFLGMCAWLKNDYKIISNREVGKGRCDIVLQSKDENKTSFVFEFKYIRDNETSQERLQTVAKQAVEQIRDRQYDIEIKGKVVYIGLAHHGKDAAIEWQEK
ncbi:ATP-binding protein [Allocoprobacillus halotolerans]|uniref:ATP-binding protein n=2 Tax=Allocoprobacillus halotolerans TaxID=2944914 RepID=A0ABY5I8V0_9FIRM|nr:AAA family ATPase [Allocoprobacillus halotolerans]UTY40799.1 ATP-binding protein [Allocoprobacillus halotolerans]